MLGVHAQKLFQQYFDSKKRSLPMQLVVRSKLLLPLLQQLLALRSYCTWPGPRTA
jgi:hypothetical protein